eukprot:CAMPEP_0172759336 /NCGR_PEP_ID=MMETSP1074-20121228/167566_1 /TAXON_ID=2916 /ORGANISM="Ceratium fusus, Strain PA161109" /LENGTH=51 /DNA_ID=CAMNT_0013593101 /DNA_START=5 /DNA_END=157 /DNA_ORIENTATION=+
MALDGKMFRVRWASGVKQAPWQDSPLFHTARAGQHVRRLGQPVQLEDGTLR